MNGTRRMPRQNKAKRSQSAAGEPPAGIPHYSGFLSFHHSSPGPIMRNEANPDAAGWDGAWGTRGEHAKQTQFRRAVRPGTRADHAKRTQCAPAWDEVRRTGAAGVPLPTLAPPAFGLHAGRLCKTNPMWGSPAGTRAASCAKQTQFPGVRAGPRANRVKQTQFAPHRAEARDGSGIRHRVAPRRCGCATKQLRLEGDSGSIEPS
jgi:hypothetical protein